MKILHVNESDIVGGAARAAYRLHIALLKNEVDSKMLVHNKLSDEFSIIGSTTNKNKIVNIFRSFLDNLPVKLYRHKTKTLFSPAWLPSNIVRKINEVNPDIVHLHWICGGMLRIEELAKIKAPIVWTLHDMWPFTGGEHLDEGQEHYIIKCGNSKVLGSKKENDLSRKIWKRKKKTYEKIGEINVISPSKWMILSAKKSSLLKDKKHIKLPNVLNTQIFKPLEKNTARDLFNLPHEKKIILFGAMATDDPNKGYSLLKNAIKLLEDEQIELVVFGKSHPKQKVNFKFKITYLGKLHDDVSLVSLYSAADVMIVPSKQESFGQTATEALSCGTPVVAFNTTGLKDIVDHKDNGYLAEAFDEEDLAKGISWVLSHKNYENLSKNARKKVIRCFSEEQVIPKYIKLYKSIT